MKGIEPSYEAWEASVLPLNYTRNVGEFYDDSRRGGDGAAPGSASEQPVFLHRLHQHVEVLVDRDGTLATGCAANRVSFHEANPEYAGKPMQSLMVYAITYDKV